MPGRTSEGVRRDMDLALESSMTLTGYKGPSPAVNLPHFDLVWGFTVEYMHAVLLGVTRQITELLLSSTNSNEHFYIDKFEGITRIFPPVAAALQYIKEQAGHTCDVLFALVGPTVDFMLMMHKWFAVMDMSNSQRHIHKNDLGTRHFSDTDDAKLTWRETRFLDYLTKLKNESHPDNCGDLAALPRADPLGPNFRPPRYLMPRGSGGDLAQLKARGKCGQDIEWRTRRTDRTATLEDDVPMTRCGRPLLGRWAAAVTVDFTPGLADDRSPIPKPPKAMSE
ncbi:hypothetical protein HPB47_001642 [Ixodes persulcatus]|uniref:Uncharacterized protein n=1 Tax=Ixodes persulcatus TaxID=34615 RepID=A0AC60PPX6_IXOPE|nr:hypothetical protein HPB47_001642 [Ixodes persulcatus]